MKIMEEDFRDSLKKMIRNIVMTVVLYVGMSCPSKSQNIQVSSHASHAEKIYLQLDSKVYTLDQTIWFKSVVITAYNHAPSKLSGVLYVELIGPDERIVEQKLIKLKEGIGDGFFELRQDYAEGAYQIRAYTEWNKNFDADFIFTEYIQLFRPHPK